MSILKVIFLAFFLCQTTSSLAHPGIGLVKDSKGNLYYTDLSQVWKISNGKKSIAVPHVHTHQLFMDKEDNLYGEDLQYDGDARATFSHSLWILRPGAIVETIVSNRQAYMKIDYSLNRDLSGNEYFTKVFTAIPDTIHLYRRSANGKELIIATGQFGGVAWFHPQVDGSILYTRDNNLYRIDNLGTIRQIATSLALDIPSFKNFGSKSVYGAWQDNTDVYVAVFSDQRILKINRKGEKTEVYHSEKNWGPTFGLFDLNGNLWVLECSVNNEIRVVNASVSANPVGDDMNSKKRSLYPILICIVTVGLFIIFRKMKRKKK